MSLRHIETLRGLRLPETSALRRDHAVGPEQRTKDYLARYDDRTLIYDAVRLMDGRVLLTCPALMNLAPLLRSGLRAPDRAPRRVRHWKAPETDQLTFALTGDTLAVEIDGDDHPVALRQSTAEAFAGLNTLVALNRDNEPGWIRDWAQYYVQAHGLQGLVLFDNRSETYAPETLMDALDGLGLESIAIYSVPFPYGPAKRDKSSQRNARLLQTSLLNLARRDMLARARAVLSVDVDEIVRAPEGVSVFDLAHARPNRFVKIHGSWVYPSPDSVLPAPHRAHDHRASPNARCNQKWCAVPSGLLSRIGWSVHQIGGPLVKLVHAEPGLELLHCRGTSTGWKRSRAARPETVAQDPDLARFFERWFSS